MSRANRGKHSLSGNRAAQIRLHELRLHGIADAGKRGALASLLSALRPVPDAKNLHGSVGHHPVRNDVGRQLRRHQLPRSLLHSRLATLRKAAQNLNRFVDYAANPIGGRKIALPLDIAGNGLQVA